MALRDFVRRVVFTLIGGAVGVGLAMLVLHVCAFRGFSYGVVIGAICANLCIYIALWMAMRREHRSGY